MRSMHLTLIVAVLVAVAISTRPDEAASKVVSDPTLMQLIVLKSDAALEAKFQACRRLAAVGDKRAVPVLAKLLDDPKLSHMARYALEPIPDPSVDAALRDAVGRVKGPLRIGVVTSLGMRRDAGAVGVLSPLLSSPEADLAGAAAVALGRIATDEAGEALKRFRATARPPLRGAAADASLILARRWSQTGRGTQAAKVLEALQKGPWPKHVRLGAFVGLLEAEPDKAAARVIRAVGSNDAQLRTTAIATIPSLGGKGVADQVAAELPKMPADVQVLLLAALAEVKGANLQPVFRAASLHKDEVVRAAALRALGTTGQASAAPFLCAALAEGATTAEKQAAAGSLRALQGDGVDHAIALCMKQKATSTAARAEMIAILADRHAVGTVGDLLVEAGRGDTAVRSAAAKALGRLAAPKNLPALLALLGQSQAETTRRDLERAAVQVARKIPEPAKQAEGALAALAQAEAPAQRGSLLRVIGTLGGSPRALQAVQAALKAKDAAERDTALRALADWPDPSALDALTALADKADDATHRVLALRGCVRLLSLGQLPADKTLAVYADLATKTKRPEDRRLLLAGLSNVADPAAIAAIEGFLADKAIRAEAELAMVKVAGALAGSDPAAARKAATRLQKESESKVVRRKAAGILVRLNRFEDYITAWQAAGPFAKKGVEYLELIDVPLGPELPGAKGVAWKPLPVVSSAKKPAWMLDLLSVFGGTQRVVYLRTWVHSDKGEPVLLEFGTDDGTKVWLNGKLVLRNQPGGTAVPGEHKIKAVLQPGWNAVQMKITQATGPWEFCFRIRAADGTPLPGLNVRAQPPAK